jgi:hypothetical protein
VTDAQAFFAGLLVTVVLLAVVVASGIAAKRRVHLPAVLLYLAALGLTIWLAVRMGRSLDLAAAGWITPVHLTMARVNVYLYVLPLTTGLMALRDRRWYRRHKLFAWIVVGVTLLTVATGSWMALAAPSMG